MSCFFDSLSHFFHVDSRILRREICNYLESNAPLFDDVPTNIILNEIDKNYVTKMRHDQTWAGGIEIRSACNLWEIVIVVHSHRTKPIIFEPISKRYKCIIHLFWTGNHYEPIKWE